MRTLATFALRVVYLALRVVWRFTRPITVGVRVMMVMDDQVLLVHHTYQDAWFMPGGAVGKGETLEQAARREAYEETRATLNNLRFIGTFTSFSEGKSDHISLFLCTDYVRSSPGEVKPVEHSDDFEIDQVKAFPLDNLPDKLATGQRRHIAEYSIDTHLLAANAGQEW